ncbi:hypothetical protein ACFE04_001620 [Oxalis oulophora]
MEFSENHEVLIDVIEVSDDYRHRNSIDQANQFMLPEPEPEPVSISYYTVFPSDDEDDDDYEEEDEEEEEEEEEEQDKRRKIERDGEGESSTQRNQSEIEGCICSICLDAWTASGEHHVCCLPCGHLYGFCCINKWARQKRTSSKCPQCNMKFTPKDIRKLYAPRIAAIDGGSQNRIHHLEGKCASLEKKNAVWSEKEADWKRRDVALRKKVEQLTKRTTHLSQLLKDSQMRSSSSDIPIGISLGEYSPPGHNFGSNFCKRRLSCSFELQSEFEMNGARLFEISPSRQIILIVRKQQGIGGHYVLTKMSLMSPHHTLDYVFTCTKAIRDIHVSPSHDNLALFASLGKKLSLFSMESDNIVLEYDLPTAAWSCSWDINNGHNVYAGLQNGMLMVFDTRQTRGPMESMMGHTCNPIHSVHSVSRDPASPGIPTVLSASSIGVCEWNIGSGEERPFLVPETANQGVCISLACCPTSDDIVASYRPKLQTFNDGALSQSQPSFTPSPSKEKGAVGSHSLLKRVSSKSYQEMGFSLANLPNVRLPKSTIIDANQNNLFVSGDESFGGVVLQELPALAVVQRLHSQTYPILDIKYKAGLGQGLMGCLSENKLELSTQKLS